MDDYVLGKKAPEGGHTSVSVQDPRYSHWCKPGSEAKDVSEHSADADAMREGQAGMSDDNDLSRSSSGAVIGSQLGAKDPGKGARIQHTEQNEFFSLDQWDGEQEHTYPEKERD